MIDVCRSPTPNAHKTHNMAIYPWLGSWQNQGIDRTDFQHLKAWFDAVGGRPAAQQAVQVLAERREPQIDPKAREALFGVTQYARR